MSETYGVCYLDKQSLLQVFKDFTFDDIKKYYPSGSTKQFVKNFKELSNNDEKKNNMFRVTVFINTLYTYFNCFWHPWKLTIRDKCFASDIIAETYENIEIVTAKFKTNEVWPEEVFTQTAKIKEHGKVLYGYLLAIDFLEGLDEIYYRGMQSLDKAKSGNYPIVLLNSGFSSEMILRYNKLSLRGNHRVKLWDTFILPNNVRSRRALPGTYWNLNPEKLYEFDEIEDTVKKVKYIFRKPAGTHRVDSLIPAIHPHIIDSTACYGGWANKFQMTADNGYAKVFAKFIRGFLQTWTASSPYWFIQNEFRNTYTFNSIKRRKLVNWSVCDSQWILRLFGKNSHREKIFPRLLSEEKHKKGFYTVSFAEKAVSLDSYRVNNTRTFELMKELFGLDDDSKDTLLSLDDFVDENPWDTLRIFYYEGWTDPRLGTKLNASGLDLIRYNSAQEKYNEYKEHTCYSTIFLKLVDKISWLTKTVLNKKMHALTYEEVNKLNFPMSIKYKDYFTKESVIEEWKAVPTLWNEEYDEKLNPLQCLYYENAFIVNLIKDPKLLDFHLKRWLRLSYESELTKLNTKKERYINAIKRIANYPEQAQLFS